MQRDLERRARTLRVLVVLVCIMGPWALSSCYVSSAARESRQLLRAGFNLEDRGPWVVFSGPGSVLLAGGNMLIGSVIPMTSVDPREPEAQWFHFYPGKMRRPEEVAVLCHERRSTWISGIRPVSSSGAAQEWVDARNRKWHFPVCVEVLPGLYELQVHYFVRQSDDKDERSIMRQAESIRPSTERWDASAGQVYALTVSVGRPEPSSGLPPQRHIPRSRALGTTWWELKESDFSIRVNRIAAWNDFKGPIHEQRRDWARYEAWVD